MRCFEKVSKDMYTWSVRYGNYVLLAKILKSYGNGVQPSRWHGVASVGVYRGYIRMLANIGLYAKTFSGAMLALQPYLDQVETRLRLGWEPTQTELVEKLGYH